MVLRNHIVDELYAQGGGLAEDGQRELVASHIAREYAEALYQAVRNFRPKAVLEVGMAFGASSLAILQALEENGDGTLTSNDPAQHTYYRGQGVENVGRAGLAHRHQMEADFDFVVLPRLLAQGARYDLIYIDGSHTFEHTLLDLFYADKLLTERGVIAINDGGYPAVHNAIRSMLAHRDYVELDRGLPAKYWDKDAQRAGRNEADRYFQRRSLIEPRWDFWEDFWVSPGQFAPNYIYTTARLSKHALLQGSQRLKELARRNRRS